MEIEEILKLMFIDNEELSFEEKIDLAREGDVLMMEEVAEAYQLGINGFQEIDVNPEKAAYWMQRSAENGNAIAMFNMGLYYANGFGVERNFETAIQWMNQAADEGDEDAVRLGNRYRKAVEILRKAEAGDPQAQGEYAEALMGVTGSIEGMDNTETYRECIKWAEKAEGKDSGVSDYILGLIYEHGRGAKKDKLKAAEYYRRGSEKGHAICLNNLGLFYMTGQGVSRNANKGFIYFLKAAEKGYGIAMQNVGYCYRDGDGTEPDTEKAIEWFEKSLEILLDEEIMENVAMLKRFKN